jgi:hypothetical protein
MSETAQPRTLRLAAFSSIAVVAASVLAIPAASGAGSTKLVTISGANIHTTASTPSIAKFGSSYEVIWVAQTGATWSIQARILNAAGKPVGKVLTATKGWTALQADPTILADGKTRVIAFSGNITSTAYNGSAEYYLTSTNGKTWKRSSGSLSGAEAAGEDNGTSVINNGGKLIAVMATGGVVRYHIGPLGTLNPEPGTDPSTTNTGSGTQLPGVGVDAKNHQVWAVWWSDSGSFGSKTLGVHAQRISPTKGTMVNGPDSTNKLDGSYGGQQDASVASRVGGGIYTVYVTADVHTIVVWKVGAKKPTAKIHDPLGISTVQIAAAPHGRLWVYWRNDDGWRATRSNKAATRFGSVLRFAVPKNDLNDLHIGSAGVAGPLEAIATLNTATSANIVVARQILARLSVSVSPHSVKRGHSFTVTVRDAGDAVKGATVHFNGAKKKTNNKGRATFKVSGGTSLGKHPVTIGLGGYAGARAQVTVTG